jgi:hypothetical protein
VPRARSGDSAARCQVRTRIRAPPSARRSATPGVIVHAVVENESAGRLRRLDQRAHDWWLAKARPRNPVTAKQRNGPRFSALQLVLAAIWLTAIDLTVSFIHFGDAITGVAFALFFLVLATFLSTVARRRTRRVALSLLIWCVFELAVILTASLSGWTLAQAAVFAVEAMLAGSALAISGTTQARQ